MMSRTASLALVCGVLSTTFFAACGRDVTSDPAGAGGDAPAGSTGPGGGTGSSGKGGGAVTSTGGSAGSGTGGATGGSSGSAGAAGSMAGSAGAGTGGSADAGSGGSAGAGTITAPRPVAPLSTSTVTSRRPTLRWALASATDGAHVDICADRACTTILAGGDVTGSSFLPSADLPTGVAYWRLRGRSGSTAGTETSPMWQFTVGARTAPVDTSWGTTLDVNGDGYADVVVGATGGVGNAGHAYVYLGSAAGLATSPATTLTGLSGVDGSFGDSVASAGDVNGDGYADVIVGASDYGGKAYVYLGSADGLAASPATSLTGPDVGGAFGTSVASAGDVNGDGYADVIVGASEASSESGKSYVYLGSAAGVATSPATTLAGPDGAHSSFGISVASAGDVNGDSYADVVVGAFTASNQRGKAYVYLGSAAGLPTSPTTTLTGLDAASLFGLSVASAGDVNGDGYADVVVGASLDASSYIGKAYVYLGSGAGLADAPATKLSGSGGANGDFGSAVASAGDVNGDGYADVVVGAPNASMSTGEAYVYLGSAAGLADVPATTLTGPDGANGEFGGSVASAGDVNGDGYADVVVGAWAVNSNTGKAYVYVGSGAVPATSPAATLTGLDGTNAQFGISVASADRVVCDPQRARSPG